MGDPFKKYKFEGTIFEQVFGKPLYQEELLAGTPTEEELTRITQATSQLFTQVVHTLRTDLHLPHRINELGVLLWDLVGNRVTPLAMTRVGSMTFMGASNTMVHVPHGTILCPWDWVDMMKSDPYMQFGAVVYIGSRCRDFYNKRLDLLDNEPSKRRAAAFESEFLWRIKKLAPTWTPNEYQATILKEYPRGLESLKPRDWYESKPYQGD